ncbi:MAG TPA: DUF3426 domain-containing protein, partial [Burkholderiales bacterium]
VRCGRCAAVFNAFDSLSILPEAPDERPEAGAPGPPAPAEEAASPPAVEAAAETAEPLPVPAVAPEAAPEVPLPPTEEPSGAGEPAAPPGLWEASASFGLLPRRRGSRAWTVGSLVLLLAFAAQLAYLLRTEIAGALPQARPWLERACAEIGCTVSVPRSIEQWSIESSDLLADPTEPNRMTLTLLLRNRATFKQEFPALELTLTDIQDQAVARRVLAAAEYLPSGNGGGDGLDPNAEVVVRLAMDTGELNAAGYRLFLFYP